jgi:hypothetical protein
MFAPDAVPVLLGFKSFSKLKNRLTDRSMGIVAPAWALCGKINLPVPQTGSIVPGFFRAPVVIIGDSGLRVNAVGCQRL